MIEKIFLALDYETDSEVLDKGLCAIEVLADEFGRDFIRERVGVKLNEDLVTGSIEKGFIRFKNEGCSIFIDKKISHGYDTGERIVDRIIPSLPIDYVTVSASLGRKILKEYVKNNNERGIKTIAFTIHTKISPEDALRMYKQPLADAIYTLAQMASEAGCDAVVMEAKMLEDKRIRGLPIKKLVTGIRVDPSDKGTQQRVTSLQDLTNLKSHVDYAVISSRYVGDSETLKDILYALK